MTHFFTHHGLPLLFVVIMLESFGIPLPGETALIFFGVLASKGNYDIASVIAVATVAAIIGDNLGYWVGRTGGRRLLERSRFVRRWSEPVLPWAEGFFHRHGAKTIFIGRFFSVLRVTAAWMAGVSRMRWWRFFAWNAAGGICWAVLVGLVAYFAGNAAADAISRYGLIAGVALVVLAAAAFAGYHVWRKRLLRAESEPS